MRLLFLAGLTAAALGLSACMAETTETPATEASQASEAAATPKAKQVSFKIDGMTWSAACPPKVSAAVAKCLGVTKDKIKVDFKTKEVTIDAEEADMKALAMALKESGFSMQGM